VQHTSRAIPDVDEAQPVSEGDWKSAITDVAPNEIRVRGYRLDELMGRIDFGQAVYLLLRGDLPDDGVGRLMTAMLVSSIDHGVTPPSVLGARNAASTGASLSASVASGVLSINRFHGGAVEDCARVLGEVVAGAAASPASSGADGPALESSARAVVASCRQRGVRIAGFGHRVHTADPRTDRLFKLADEAAVSGAHCRACRLVEAELERQSGRGLPINVDGALAAVLGDLGFEIELMNSVFIIARTAGLIAHAREERIRQRPMRRIDPAACAYDGPGPRALCR